MKINNHHFEDAAKASVGNWKKWESFAWHRGRELEDADQWAIFNTTNRDADLLTQSNHATISKTMAPFMQGDDPDCVDHGASHWACGWTEGFEIRVYDSKGNITDAFKAWTEMAMAIESYPVLDESDYSEREYEATCDNIKDIGYSMVSATAPESWPYDVFGSIWDCDSSELESRDGQGGYPSKESVRTALEALGMLAIDDE